MTNFLLLSTGGSMPETEEEQAAVMKAWTDWYEQLDSAVVDAGNPLAGAKSIAADGSVSDGPVGPMASGYIIIAADSIDDAVDKAKSCPVLAGGAQLSVYETFPVM